MGSDNVSYIALHDNIPYIHHRNLNTRTKIKISNWIYTESCTGKNQFDTHFSFLALLINTYVLNGNNVKTELDIYKAMPHGNGLDGTSAVFFDGSNLAKCVFDKPGFKATKTGV